MVLRIYLDKALMQNGLLGIQFWEPLFLDWVPDILLAENSTVEMKSPEVCEEERKGAVSRSY